jgi:EAL domain-containing protein (putative c-di-GMP-specific phosphodiesterase class I)
VIERVFLALERLQASGMNLSHWRFAINLCGPSLGNQALIDLVAREVDRLDLPEGQLSFEITETAAISNLTEAVGFIQQLKYLGCEVALDDFGSGLSSFAYPKNLPVDYLKIDGAFVRDLMKDPIDAAMVDAINRIGHVMHIRTIAEFVESNAVRERLAEMGVDYGQGYAIAEPRPLDELIEQAGLLECDSGA